eukprot:11154735-Alexandrium_andersonii.AAC.1
MEVRPAGAQRDSIPVGIIPINAPLQRKHRAHHRAGIMHWDAGVVRRTGIPPTGQKVSKMCPPRVQYVTA